MYTKNRGMFLESMINKTLKFYSVNEVALFHKKNLDINFSGIKRNAEGKPEIKRGWISGKSTSDYYGIYNGRFITFEAKSTNERSLPLSNIKDHQYKYLLKINKLGGLGFFVIYYGIENKFFILKPESLEALTQKSISIEFARSEGIEVEIIYPGIIDFLPALDKLL